MRYNDESHPRGRRVRGPGRFEPANDAEARRWHDRHHHHDVEDEDRGPRGRGRRGGPFGPDPRLGFGGPDFPGKPGFPGGPGMHGMHGFGPWMREGRGRGRARRGDVRAAALSLLAEQPMNGYQIIQEIGERSGGVWRPSPGSIYPALQQLEDEGFIRTEAADGGRRAYQLTEEGRAYAESHAAELRAPWDEVSAGSGGVAAEIRSLIGQLAMAAVQVVQVGSETQVGQAKQLLTETRKALYRILAADDDDETSGAAE